MRKLSRLSRRVLRTAIPVLCFVLSPAARGEEGTALLRDLKSSDAKVREQAAEALSEGAPVDLTAALPALTEALEDENANVRFFTAVVLSKAAYSDESSAALLRGAAGALAEHLADPDPRVRESLALAFALMQPAVPLSSVPALLGRLGDPAGKVNTYALQALARVRPVEPPVVDAVLGELKKDQSSTVRGTAAHALGSMADTRREVIEALAVALRDPAPFVRQEAVRALGEIGPPAAPALGELDRLIKDPGSDEALRQNVKAAILRIKGQR